MRWLVTRGALVLFPLLGCSGNTTTKGQLMLAVQTDMSLPKDVDRVRIEVIAYGSPLFANDYDVGPAGLHIPATLGIVAGNDPSTPVHIRVIARQSGKPRMLRETVTTVPADRIAT